jgi:hypothetical protein
MSAAQPTFDHVSSRFRGSNAASPNYCREEKPGWRLARRFKNLTRGAGFHHSASGPIDDPIGNLPGESEFMRHHHRCYHSIWLLVKARPIIASTTTMHVAVIQRYQCDRGATTMR